MGYAGMGGSCQGGVCYVGWGGSCKGEMGHAWVGWVMQGLDGS